MLLRALLAAAIGTIVMNLSSETEMAWRGRAPSTAPGRATNRLLRVVGVPVLEGRSLQILSSWTHYLYGTAWGLWLWLVLEVANLGLVAGGALFFLGVWLTEQIELPLLGVAPWSWTWGAKEVAIDLSHHVVYAAGTVAAWSLLGVLSGQPGA